MSEVPDLVQIGDIVDPVERAKAATAYIFNVRVMEKAAQHVRDDAVADMLIAGWSVRKAAAEVDLSPARVQQIKAILAHRSVQ